MNTGDYAVIIAILIYFMVVLIIGFSYARRANKSSSEYFLGGRKVGPWFTALSAEASDMSGYLLMGLPGLAYFTGAADAGWTCIGLALGTYFNWLLVAKRLRRYSEKANDSITLPGFYSNRFHDTKNVVSTVAAVIILIFFCVYTGSCFVTCGKLFNTLFGMDYTVMMIFGAIIVFLYTMVGGYLSVVATDFVQGCLMFFALAVVVIGSIAMAGGVENTAAFLSDIPGYLSMVQTATPEVDADGVQYMIGGAPIFGIPAEYGLLTIISTLSWGLGYFGMPPGARALHGHPAMTARCKTSRRIAIVWVVVSMFCAIMIGIIGRYLFPASTSPNPARRASSSSCRKSCSPVFSAAWSSRAFLPLQCRAPRRICLITGSSVAENIFRGVFKKDATDNQVLIVSRHHAGLRPALRHCRCLERGFDHLQRRLVRLGWPGCLVRAAHALQPVLEAHDQVRRHRGHADGRRLRHRMA